MLPEERMKKYPEALLVNSRCSKLSSIKECKFFCVNYSELTTVDRSAVYYKTHLIVRGVLKTTT